MLMENFGQVARDFKEVMVVKDHHNSADILLKPNNASW